MKIFKFFFLCLLLNSCNSGSENQDSEPLSNLTDKDTILAEESESLTDADAKIAIEFVNSYIENCNKMSEAVDVVTWCEENQNVTEEFNLQLNKMVTEAFAQDPDFGLGYDPIINGQDYPDQGFELQSFETRSGKVVLKGIGMESQITTVKLLRQNGKVRVDGCGAINLPKDF